MYSVGFWILLFGVLLSFAARFIPKDFFGNSVYFYCSKSIERLADEINELTVEPFSKPKIIERQDNNMLFTVLHYREPQVGRVVMMAEIRGSQFTFSSSLIDILFSCDIMALSCWYNSTPSCIKGVNGCRFCQV